MIYFDNGSTTKISEPVYEKLCDFLKNNFANPSSLHSIGFEAEKELIEARKKVANALNVTPDEIYFTSGGTEANNTAVLGIAEAYKKRGNKVITSNIEHPSVADSFKELEARGFEVVTLNADEKGYINLEELEREVDENTILVSIMYVNNEVGTVQPIEKMAEIIKSKNKNCMRNINRTTIYLKNRRLFFKVLSFVILFLVCTQLAGCHRKPASRAITGTSGYVDEIIDGKTIKLTNELKVNLIGVIPSELTKRFLEDNLIDAEVTLIADSNDPIQNYSAGTKESINAYVIVKDDELLNCVILFSELDGWF